MTHIAMTYVAKTHAETHAETHESRKHSRPLARALPALSAAVFLSLGSAAVVADPEFALWTQTPHEQYPVEANLQAAADVPISHWRPFYLPVINADPDIKDEPVETRKRTRVGIEEIASNDAAAKKSVVATAASSED